jgi:hypothetical protein
MSLSLHKHKRGVWHNNGENNNNNNSNNNVMKSIMKINGENENNG